jgi:hypothetical protein
MVVERDQDRVIITVSSSVDHYALNRLIDYMKYLEDASNSRGKPAERGEPDAKTRLPWWRKSKKYF